MAVDREEFQQMLEDCEERESKLTEWEQGFIQSMRDKFDRGYPITEPMDETLTKIWEKVT